MIFVDRYRIPMPEVLSGPQIRSRLEAAAEFFANGGADRYQRRFDFSIGVARQDVLAALQELFYGKCAYCEQAIEIGIDRYRPAANAVGLQGQHSPEHYWWLAFDWSNLYPACSGCSRAKANRFPVEGERARIGRQGDALRLEGSLLLDPCSDNPEDHLAFEPDGHVAPKTKRGEISIKIFALNRPQLVNLRRIEAKRLERELINDDEQVVRMTADDMPFAAMRRALFNRPARHRRMTTERDRQERRLANTQYKVGPSATAEDLAVERSLTRYIERVTLKNIGIHGSLDLHTARGQTSDAPWMMLLGENGVGKSTLLKAIVFALSTPKQRLSLREYSSSVEPRDDKIGSIAIHYTDGEIVRVTIDPSAKRIESSFVEPRFRLLALGATRLPPTDKRRPPPQPSYAKVRNLFDPYCPLDDSVAWLSKVSPEEFERAGTALKALLDLPPSALFEREGRDVALRQGAHSQDLRVLSDGYQTIIGIACAVMSALVAPDQPVENAEGIVLIDEIGNHLHPSWRMRIVSGLKAAFPRVQFIATTHEPLCLRGLVDGEVAVLRRNTSHRSALIDELPSVRGLLVDQILSSAHFGLGSTIDPETSKKFERYYELLSRKEVSANERVELDKLQHELDRIRLIGNTPSEQILIRTIDERVARANKAGTPLDPGNLPDDLQDELIAILNMANPDGQSDGDKPR